ncbi:peptidoglycan DD-metalloendopeptidase family protein [Rubrobacter tropicus]|uniref:Peptidoglycan DD-metalloendopeptidase family protein n=1 Tax=Rubrobacter tropicus TaxID=2653851 RepID=A0A6G8QDN6_9ACTN|nr:CAP domain-containing protein [Rubrobacter tropicus]QIN84620.1 peptidoglycan DD-metalloendopeptidase family protein [Rubrobacter tropicus]
MLLAFAAGVVLSLGLIVVVLLSSVNAVTASCRADARAAENATALPGGGGSSYASPSYVSQGWGEDALSDIPEEYLRIYESVAEEYGLDAAILAAIGKIETDHGRLDAPGVTSGENPWGAGGPMQFLASTWANVGVDGDGDGIKDRYDPEDAIPGAANYLKLSGAPQDYRSAILAYNQAEWYYQDVVAQAEEYRGSGGGGEGGEMASGGTPAGENRSPLAALLSLLATKPAYAEETSGTVGSPGETDYSPVEIDALNLINDYREENGLRPLELSDKLSTASARYAHDMAKYDAYEVPEPHVSGPTDYYFEGATLTDRANREGYYASHYGENIAAGQDTGQKVFDAWRNSPPHNDMMLNPEMTTIGVGLVAGGSASYDSFWVTDFGSDEDDTTRPVPEAGDGSVGGTPKAASDARAVFPLPEDYLDDYEDTWGASRSDGRTHEGTDVFAPDGTPIYSITGGKVVPVSGSDSRGWDDLGGWTVMVEATEGVGPVEAGDTLLYAHMNGPTGLKPGDVVEAGQQIGEVGSTGEGPPGSVLPDGRGGHLHLGWYTDGSGSRAEAGSGAMNPYPLLEWLRDNGGAAGGEGSLAPAPSTADLPAHCRPLQLLGLVPTVAENSGGPSPMGTEFVGATPSQTGGAVSGSATGQQVVEEAKKYLGVPYVLGPPEDCVPGEAMDCTCLTTTVFAEFGYQLPDMPTENADYGDPVEGEPQAGDLLVWDDPGDGTYGHVAISTGEGQIIHANMGTMDTSVTPMWDSPEYMGARRLVG